MADQDRNRALQNPATAPTKPRWSAIGSPEADDRREPASPDRHTKTTPPRARLIPASLPPVRYPQIRESRRPPKLYGFFNSLLMPVGEQPAAHGSRVCRMEAPSDVVSAHRPPPYQVKGNPAKRTQRGSSVAAFPYCLPVASRTASLALPTPLRM